METFPIYRRTADGRHAYRIEAPDRFTEIQFVGRRVLLHEVVAKAYPEKLRIVEMIALADGRYVPLAPGDWQDLHDRWKGSSES